LVPYLYLASEFHSRVSCGKTRIMGHQAMEKIDGKFSRFDKYTNITDGRTDGHRTTAKTALCIASRGKNDVKAYFQQLHHTSLTATFIDLLRKFIVNRTDASCLKINGRAN